MTFIERYRIEQTWQGKVLILETYHLTALSLHKNWTLEQTAEVFDVSIGLVSENLKLADAIHKNPLLEKCNTRNEALNKIR